MHVINDVVNYAICFFFFWCHRWCLHMCFSVMLTRVNTFLWCLVYPLIFQSMREIQVSKRNRSFHLKTTAKRQACQVLYLIAIYIYLSMCLALERSSEAIGHPGRINSSVCFSLRKSVAVRTNEFCLCFTVLLLWRSSAVSVPKL